MASSSIESYLKSQAGLWREQNRKRSRTEYTQPYLRDADRSYEDALTRALQKRNLSSPYYGELGASLSKRGLEGGGFSDYLDSYMKSQLNKSVRSAEAKRTLDYASAGRGYGEYLKEYEKDQRQSSAAALSRIMSSDITDRDTAYSLALSLGLEDGRARAVAALGMDMLEQERKLEQTEELTANSRKLRRQVISDLMDLALSYEYGYAYAIAMGLTEEDADRIARATEAAIKNQGSASNYFER